MHVILHFDGGSTPTQKNSDGKKTGPGLTGCGWHIADHQGKPLTCGYAYVGDYHTNNEGEYHGLIHGLTHALEIGATQVAVYGDSSVVIGHCFKQWQCNYDHLRILRDQVFKLLAQFSVSCTGTHVLRAKNARADLLADTAVATQSSAQGPRLLTPALLRLVCSTSASVPKTSTKIK